MRSRSSSCASYPSSERERVPTARTARAGRSKGPAGAGMGAVGAPRARARPGTAPARKWMEAYEVFDAEDGELMEELRLVAGLAGGAAERHRELVRQELQERGVSESLQQDIREELAGGAGVAGDAAGGPASRGPEAESPTPENDPAISSLEAALEAFRQERNRLGRAAQQVSKKRAGDLARPPASVRERQMNYVRVVKENGRRAASPAGQDVLAKPPRRRQAPATAPASLDQLVGDPEVLFPPAPTAGEGAGEAEVPARVGLYPSATEAGTSSDSESDKASAAVEAFEGAPKAEAESGTGIARAETSGMPDTPTTTLQTRECEVGCREEEEQLATLPSQQDPAEVEHKKKFPVELERESGSGEFPGSCANGEAESSVLFRSASNSGGEPESERGGADAEKVDGPWVHPTWPSKHFAPEEVQEAERVLSDSKAGEDLVFNIEERPTSEHQDQELSPPSPDFDKLPYLSTLEAKPSSERCKLAPVLRLDLPGEPAPDNELRTASDTLTSDGASCSLEIEKEAAKGTTASEDRPSEGRPPHLTANVQASGRGERGSSGPEAPRSGAMSYAKLYKDIQDIFPIMKKREEGNPNATAEIARSQAKRLLELQLHFEGMAGSRSAEERMSSQLFRVLSSSHCEVHKLVCSAVAEIGGWELDTGEIPESHWNLLWTWSGKVAIPRSELNVWQQVNHYPKAGELTKKDALKRHLARCKAVHPGKNCSRSPFDIMPQTFILPGEYVQFCDAFSKERDLLEDCPEQNVWIMKPVGMSRGRGIFLINDILHVAFGEQFVIQKYIRDPLLLDGYKFDLRLYVLVTSFSPLEAFIYGEGFARFSSMKYTLDDTTIANHFMHLTNSSIQKQRGDDAIPEPLREGKRGDTKCSLTEIFRMLEERGVECDPLWDRIIDTVLASLFAVEVSIPHQANSFELFGYDVIIDSDLQPKLLEVNTSPSLSTSTPLDMEVKKALIRDTISLVNPLRYNRQALQGMLTRQAGRRPPRRSSLVHGSKGGSGGALQKDLDDVLMGQAVRQFGEIPEHMGRFQRIAPSPASEKFHRLTHRGSSAAGGRHPKKGSRAVGSRGS